MADIVLTTLNARYIHASFGLRYLLANLGSLKSAACLLEFDIHQRPLDIVEAILARQPKIVGLGVYIWNVNQTREVVSALKRIRPGLFVVLGGPEVSYETEGQPVVEEADFVITGEADLQFAGVCRQLLCGERPLSKVIPAAPPDVGQLTLPYDLYTDEDIAHRIIYVEASRGCPFTCEFCLSSLDIPVRQAPLPALLAHLERLLERGVRHFKFVDRTFNLNLRVGQTLLQFFLDRYRDGVFLHFEMIPDRLPGELRDLIRRFPAGALQFEVGIQTFDEATSRNISRRQNYGKLADNLQFLRKQTGVHVHADLIAGLPGESLESFADGFDRLVGLGPQEIQVGLLKRLRGTPIVRHDREWGMVYNPAPPYEILQNKLIDFATVQRVRRFARFWDLVGNSGNFVASTPLLWRGENSPFRAFMRWSDWLFSRIGRQHGIALGHLAERLFKYLTEELRHDPVETAELLWRDWQRTGRTERPEFLRAHLSPTDATTMPANRMNLPKRQARHVVSRREEDRSGCDRNVNQDAR